MTPKHTLTFGDHLIDAGHVQRLDGARERVGHL